MFVDHVTIRVTAGTGGSGAMSLARRKYQAKGGPDGGDGGHGGSIFLKADANLSTLLDYRYKTIWTAQRGLHGKGKNMTGRSGEDLVMPVPPGTIVEEADGTLIGELVRAGDELRVARGGRGGRGNAKFATSTHRTPREWEPGEEGEDREITLTLKLIADVGLVGEPNAGKSTLLSVISAARPKIADYPFTTLEPNLGVVGLSESRSLVVADIPGIIEGAHEGKGLGLRFLQHVERTRILAFLIPLDSPNPQVVYDQLRHEIRSYSEALFAKPHLVLLSKRDLIPESDSVPELVTPGAIGTLEFSSAGRLGLEALCESLWSAVTHAKAEEAAMLAAEDESDPEWM